MNDFFKDFQTYKQLQESVKLLTDPTTRSLIRERQQIIKMITTQNPLVGSEARPLQASHILLDDCQLELAKLAPQLRLITEMQSEYKSLIQSTIQMQESGLLSKIDRIAKPIWNNSELQDSIAFFQRRNSALPFSLNWSSSLRDITIHKDYVSVPEALIPDGFDCEEITPQSNESLAEKTKVKHLSYTNAIALLAIIIPLLCWIITCIREDISSNQEQLRHQESIAVQKEAIIVQKEANRLQEEENQIQQKQLEATEKIVAHLFATYQQLQEFDLTSQNTDSHCQCAPSQSEPAPLQSDLDAPSNPTEVDAPGYIDGNANSFELPSKPEQQ